jgi:hypothetical protein
MSYIGYNFEKINSGGLGAIIYNILIAYFYSQQMNVPFGLVKEGYSIPRLNGSIIDVELTDMYWHSYFKTFPIVNENECMEVWDNQIPIDYLSRINIELASDLLRNRIFILQDDILDIITKKISETRFDPSTDIVLHIRRTDKISESQFIPIEKYVDECQYVLENFPSENNRIYICTDDQSVCIDITPLHI